MKKLLAVLIIVLLSFVVINPTEIYAKESKSCKTIDGAYYGKNGKETDKGTYEKECVSHKCELVADAYFGKDGNSCRVAGCKRPGRPALQNRRNRLP